MREPRGIVRPLLMAAIAVAGAVPAAVSVLWDAGRSTVNGARALLILRRPGRG